MGLTVLMRTYSFVFLMFFLQKLLNSIFVLSNYFQQKNIGITFAKQLLDFRIKTFSDLRTDKAFMFRHILPNAMVATLTFLPFIVTGAISALASLDFLGFGLPANLPSLGELTQQAKQNLQAPWLGFTAFFTFAIMLALLVFIFEGVRDAFDPRKTFA